MLRARLAFGSAVALLAALAWLGISGGLREIAHSATAVQRIQAFSQVAYGILSVGVIATAWFRSATPWIQLAWMITVGLSGGLAPIAWGGSGLVIGLIAGASSLLVGWGMIRLLNFGVRGLRRT